MRSEASSVKEYLAGLPGDRRTAIETVRDLVNANLPTGDRESVGYGMIVWCVPLEVFPETDNGQPLLYAALASQKNDMAVYRSTVYGDPKTEAAFRAAFAKAGKKPDMGKSCVRFRRLEGLHLPAVAGAISACSLPEFVRRSQAARAGAARKAARPAASRPGETGASVRKTARAKPTTRKPAR